MRTLRDAFANEWCASEGSVSLDYLKDAFTAAGQTQRFDVSAEMAALLLRLTSLVQILERMHAAANWCEQIAGQPGQQARSGIAEVAAGLTNSLDALKGSAAQHDWSIFRPVVHYLDWRFRVMPAMPPSETFGYHAREYRAVARLLRQEGSLVSEFVAANHEAVESR